MSLLDAKAPYSVETGLYCPTKALFQQALAFYVDGLGLRPIGSIDVGGIDIHGLRWGSGFIKLRLDQSTPDDGPYTPPPAEKAKAQNYLSFRVASVHDVLARLETLDPVPATLVPLREVTVSNGVPVRYAFVLDPLGNSVELAQGDAWKGTENGWR